MRVINNIDPHKSQFFFSSWVRFRFVLNIFNSKLYGFKKFCPYETIFTMRGKMLEKNFPLPKTHTYLWIDIINEQIRVLVFVLSFRVSFEQNQQQFSSQHSSEITKLPNHKLNIYFFRNIKQNISRIWKYSGGGGGVIDRGNIYEHEMCKQKKAKKSRIVIILLCANYCFCNKHNEFFFIVVINCDCQLSTQTTHSFQRMPELIQEMTNNNFPMESHERFFIVILIIVDSV